MLSCSIRFSAPSLSMGGGLESCCVGCVCGADVHTTTFNQIFVEVSALDKIYFDC